MYIGTKNAAVKAFIDGETVPLWLIGTGVAVFAASFYLLWLNRTPLPDDWSDDFRGEERETYAETEEPNNDEEDRLN